MARSPKTPAAALNDRTVLVLQGGGALGAFQAGAFEALAAAERSPDWVAGISIGAINAALIAGNPPARRIERLRAFWDRVTASVPAPAWVPDDGPLRDWASACAAAWGVSFGLPAFFTPRPGATWWPGEMAAASYYDTEPLRHTLTELVDFDLLNAGAVRISVGAVDVLKGNFVYFDSSAQRIEPEHIMASGALPPGFPAIDVGGRPYWDGGLVSNTPLRHVVDQLRARSATVFQVDLFSAEGPMPRTMAQVAEREKDIRYSSRTRAITDMLRERHELHARLHALAQILPAARRQDPAVQALLADTLDTAITLVHLIHRHKGSETQTKDFEFSPTAMREHWQSGRQHMAASLVQLDSTRAAPLPGAFEVFDFKHASQRQGATA